MRSAIAELRKRAETGWWMLLVVAICSLALAAVATIAGNAALSRTLGTIAWSAALGGSVSGLLVGVGRRTSS